MRIHRRWWLYPSLLAVALYAGNAVAQQPPGDQPAAPAPAKKPKKPPASTTAEQAASAAAGGAKPTLLGQYGEWGAYTASPGGKKICFAIAKPSTSETTPPGKSRNPSFMFISTRPGDRVANELSIVIGYPFKATSDATVEVGSVSYALYTQQDGAWIKNATEETRLIDAMRAAQNVVVKGVSAKGTHSTDVFSLKGFAQALDRSDQDCK